MRDRRGYALLQKLRDEEDLFPLVRSGGTWEIAGELFTSGGRFKLALVYPGTYTEGMSSLGFQQVWKLFKLEGINVQRSFIEPRFFIDGSYRTVEEFRDLRKFELVGFSVAYELQIFKLIDFYLSLGLDPQRKPFTAIMGGPITYMNFKPFLPLVDLVARGDGEVTIPEIARGLGRGYLKEGVIPQEGIAKIRELEPAFTPILTPRSEFSWSLLLEVNRGCGFKCKFCVVPRYFSPLRLSKREDIEEIISIFYRWAKETAPERRPKVGLVTTFFGPRWVKEILRTWKGKLEFSFSSLRPELLDEELLEILAQNSVSFTVAPETGSDELRALIGKTFSNDLLLNKLRIARRFGFQKLKVYLMLGLPPERDEHIHETAELLKAISDLGFSEIRASISPFVPKPGTPLGRYPIAPEKLIKSRLRLLRKLLKDYHNVHIQMESYKRAKLEWEIANGDEELGLKLLEVKKRDKRV